MITAGLPSPTRLISSTNSASDGDRVEDLRDARIGRYAAASGRRRVRREGDQTPSARAAKVICTCSTRCSSTVSRLRSSQSVHRAADPLRRGALAAPTGAARALRTARRRRAHRRRRPARPRGPARRAPSRAGRGASRPDRPARPDATPPPPSGVHVRRPPGESVSRPNRRSPRSRRRRTGTAAAERSDSSFRPRVPPMNEATKSSAGRARSASGGPNWPPRRPGA
jgi:hypothetical protein